LKCIGNPTPALALSELRKQGFVGRDPFVVMDGAPVFKLLKPFQVLDLKVLEVSGFDPASSKYRGPGTAPPLSFSVVVEGETKAVQAAIRQVGVSTTTSVNPASYSKYPAPAAEITCFGK
jgi:hypothetical protein